MTTLVLLRHAKAVAKDPDGDHNRPLNERGRAAAAAAGALLRDLEPPIDLALASDARRTRQTAEIVLAAFKDPPELRLEPELYGASPSDILERLRLLDTDVATVLVVGHNPGIGEVARQLCGTGNPKGMGRMRDHFPTASIAILDFGSIPWSKLQAKRGVLRSFVSADEAD